MLPTSVLREELLADNVDFYSLGFLVILIGGSVIHKPDLTAVERSGSDWDAVGVVASKTHAADLIRHSRDRLSAMMRFQREKGSDESWENILASCSGSDWEIIRVSGWTKEGSKRTLKIISQECIESLASSSDLRKLGVLSHKALECIQMNHPTLGSYLFCVPATVLGAAGFVMPDADFLTVADGRPGEPCVWPGLVIDTIFTSMCLFEASPGLHDSNRRLLLGKWLSLAKSMDPRATMQNLLPYLYRWKSLCPEFIEILRYQLRDWERTIPSSGLSEVAKGHDAAWRFHTLNNVDLSSTGFRKVLVHSTLWTTAGVHMERVPLDMARWTGHLPDGKWSLQHLQHHPSSSFSRNSQCRRGFLVHESTGGSSQEVLLKSSKTMSAELQALPSVKHYFPINSTQELMAMVENCIVYRFIPGKSVLDARLDHVRQHHHEARWGPTPCSECLTFQRYMIAVELRRARDVTDAYRASWTIAAKVPTEATIHQFFYFRLRNDQRIRQFYIDAIQPFSHVQSDMSVVIEKFLHLPIKVNGVLHDSLRTHLTEAEKVLNPDSGFFQKLPIAFGLGDGHGGNVLLQDGSSTTVPALKYIDYEVAGYHNPLLDLAKPIYLDCFYEVLWADLKPSDISRASNWPTVEWTLQEDQLVITYEYTPDFLSKILAFAKLEHTLRFVLERISRTDADAELIVAAESILANALFCSAVLTRDFSRRADLFFLNLAVGVQLADDLRTTIDGLFGWGDFPSKSTTEFSRLLCPETPSRAVASARVHQVILSQQTISRISQTPTIPLLINNHLAEKERSMSEHEHTETFDYIVCGGGTSGCVVAGRLSKALPECSVLLLEAGADDRGKENSTMPGGWNLNFGTDRDWNFVNSGSMHERHSSIKLSRGRLIGGSSATNGTICVRGSPQDFDDWGIEGWSGKEMFDYMRKVETFHPAPWHTESTTHHGYTGPIHTEPHELAPISERMLDSFQSFGLPLDPDMFTSGDNPHGCGHAPRTHWNGLRSTSAAYLTPCSNLEIRTRTMVDRILLERRKSGELCVAAVLAVTEDGKRMQFNVSKEVVLSGGAYCSPGILLRSGIGPQGDLERLGIPCHLNLPGVGSNLLDHPIVFIFYETDQKGLTKDSLMHHGPTAYENARELWLQDKTGILSSIPFGAVAFARLDDRLSDSQLWRDSHDDTGRDPMGRTKMQPHIEFFTTECYAGLKEMSAIPEAGQHVFGIVVELLAPRSFGKVQLTSKDPNAKMVVQHNYLTDSRDDLVLAEACRFANEIVTTGSGTEQLIKGSWPPASEHHILRTREEWAAYARKNVTSCFHAAGTCKLGAASDPMAVLDAEMHVHGIDNLRVADCSVMPMLNGGHTQMPAYAIGEKAVDMIIAAHKAPL
ncbi:hypothetical protein KVT40_001889 [Elsinoe batatas]|uniref:Glucose-methanol-choline oxidoreductase N-terminal domain-containing protein n=1 Tax=Elsinoe batatas TaxID=2601811 RepID=A0A8K0PFG1_9PEZI|nr:hypothetical protein KVT40_001889 [Elsinoe batatas]